MSEDHVPSDTETYGLPAHSVLLNARAIQKRVADLALEIQREYQGQTLTVLGLLRGSFIFVADLIRELKMPLEIEFTRVHSYGNDTLPECKPQMQSLPPLKEGPLLVVDDILDTGNTLFYFMEKLKTVHSGPFKTCVLLDKPGRRQVPVQADFIGFTIPDHYVFGYGLDYQGKYRNLPYIAGLNTLN